MKRYVRPDAYSCHKKEDNNDTYVTHRAAIHY